MKNRYKSLKFNKKRESKLIESFHEIIEKPLQIDLNKSMTISN